MSLKKLKKEKLELMSNKDIALLVLQDNKKPMITADIFKKIIELLELPESTFEKKIGEFYTQLATDKNFILLDDGTWDLRVNHKSSKVLDTDDESEEDEDDEDLIEEIEDDEDGEDNYDDDDDFVDDSTDEDLKDLVIIDEDELELDS